MEDNPKNDDANKWRCRHCKKLHLRGQKYCADTQGEHFVPTPSTPDDNDPPPPAAA